jgi:hypothetical protein
MKNKKVCNFIGGFDVFLQLSRRLFINWGEALNFPSSSFLTRSKPQSTYMAVRRAPTHWYYTFPMSYINFLVTFCKSVVCRENDHARWCCCSIFNISDQTQNARKFVNFKDHQALMHRPLFTNTN